MKAILLTYLIGMLTLINVELQAQCDGCSAIKAYTADFCYTDSIFESYCAQFKAGDDQFRLQTGKKVRTVPIVELEDMPAVVALSKQKSLKLSGTDLLFMMEALKAWKTAERDIGMVALGFGDFTHSVGELQRGDEVGKREYLVKVMAFHDLPPSSQLLLQAAQCLAGQWRDPSAAGDAMPR